MTASLPLFPAFLLGLLACEPSATSDRPPGGGAPLPALPDRREADTLPPPESARPVRELVIALTGELRGEVKPCGCPTTPYGGFARRARLLERISAEGPPVFQLDAGEMLVKGLRTEPTPERRARAETVLGLARALGLDAWAPAPIDVEALDGATFAPSGALAANAAALGVPLTASTVLVRDGVRLGVVGLANESAFRAGPGGAVAAVRAAVDPAQADAWVVLSNAPGPVNVAVAEQVAGIGAVLSTRGETHDPPLPTAGAPVIETPDRGRYLTTLRVALGAGPGAWSVVPATGGRAAPLLRLATERTLAAKADASLAEAARARVARARVDALPLVEGRRLVVVEDVPLGSELDARPPAVVASAVDAALERWTRRSATDAEARADATRPGASGYAGSGACARCHAEHLAAWAYTPHAKAHGSLVARGAGTDPECLGCHTTGWGEPGGYGTPTPAALRAWKAVQCEACHGPMAGHPEPRGSASTADAAHATVSEATCRRCHDAANSPQFDYGTYLKRVSCVMVDADPTGTAPVESPLGR